jgi:hypothetical protein
VITEQHLALLDHLFHGLEQAPTTEQAELAVNELVAEFEMTRHDAHQAIEEWVYQAIDRLTP